MFSRFLLFICLTVCTITLSAQVSGRLVGEDELCVPFSIIKVSPGELSFTADEQGEFTFTPSDTGEIEITIQAIGYRPYRHRVDYNGRTLALGDILLQADVTGLNEVVVSGTMKETFISDSPVKIEIINSRYLETSIAPTSLVDGVRMINGVQEVVACGVCFTNQISVNGLPGTYTAVLMDGSPIYGNLASVYGLNGIPNQMVERIEVIKGPSSTLYGSEAVGGVLNIITKDPGNEPVFAADVMGTSHLESFTNIAFAPRIGKAKGYVGVNHAYINDFDDVNNDGFGDVANLDRLSLFSKWTIPLKYHRTWTIAGKYYYEDRRNGVEEYLKDRAYQDLRGNDSIYGESIYTNRAEVFGTLEFPFKEQDLRLDYSFSSHDQDSYYGADHYEAQQYIAFGNFIYNKPFDGHDLTAGVTLRYQFYDDNTVATRDSLFEGIVNRPDAQFIPGFFIQDEWEVSRKWTILAGSRLDHYERHGLIPAPRLNVKFDPNDLTSFRLNLGTGFRIVNLFTEDHAFVTGQREVEILESLDPESSYNATLNWNQMYFIGESTGSVDVDFFYTYFTNRITPDYDTPGKIIYANSEGSATSRGIGVNVNHQFRFPLSINAGATFMEVFSESPGASGSNVRESIEFAPDWTGVASLNYRWKKTGLMFAYTLNLTGPMKLPELFDLDENGVPVSQPRPTQSNVFAFQNLQITKTFKKLNLSLYLGVQNLFNYIQEYSPLVGYNDPNSPLGFSQYFDTAYAYGPTHSRELYFGIRWNTGKR